MADNLPDLTTAFESDIGSGFEEVTSSDIQIPFLRIIQALSPQLKKSDAGFIQGASSGDIFNNTIRWSCHFRYTNMVDQDFIDRGFPNPYIYKPTTK